MTEERDRTARAALDLFGIRDTPLRALGSERDSNFLVMPRDATWAILKLVSEPDAARSVALQAAALDHLAHAAPSVALPRVLPALTGEGFVALGDGTVAWLLSYLPGRMLCEVAAPLGTLRSLGRACAGLSLGLAGFTHPALDRVLAWDVTRAGASLDKLPHVADGRSRSLAAAAIEQLVAHLPALRALPQQALHGDLNPYNVLIGPDGAISGIIDLGDMHRGPRVAELAIAVAYHLAAGRGAVLALLQGASKAMPLNDDERALLPVLAAARLGMTVAIATARARTQPHHAPYLTRNVPAAVAGLEWLAASPDAGWARAAMEEAQ